MTSTSIPKLLAEARIRPVAAQVANRQRRFALRAVTSPADNPMTELVDEGYAPSAHIQGFPGGTRAQGSRQVLPLQGRIGGRLRAVVRAARGDRGRELR